MALLLQGFPCLRDEELGEAALAEHNPSLAKGQGCGVQERAH